MDYEKLRKKLDKKQKKKPMGLLEIMKILAIPLFAFLIPSGIGAYFIVDNILDRMEIEERLDKHEKAACDRYGDVCNKESKTPEMDMIQAFCCGED